MSYKTQLLLAIILLLISTVAAYADDKYYMDFVYGQPKCNHCKHSPGWNNYDRDQMTQDTLNYRFNPQGAPIYSEFGILQGYTKRNPNGTGTYMYGLQGENKGFFNYSNP